MMFVHEPKGKAAGGLCRKSIEQPDSSVVELYTKLLYFAALGRNGSDAAIGRPPATVHHDTLTSTNIHNI